MNAVIIFAMISSVFIESQLVASTPTGDPILIGKSHKTTTLASVPIDQDFWS